MANFLLIFGWIVVPVISIILTWYYSQEIPKGLPDDQLTGLLVSSFGLDTLRFLAYTATFIGMGNSALENLNGELQRLSSVLPKDEESEKYLEIQDGKIANIPVRIYKPKIHGNKMTTGVVYLHGGGFTIGSVDQFHPFTLRLAKEANVVLVAVEYRLAPKHTFPAQFHDAYAVVKTLLATGGKYGIDTNRIIVAGDSAGGNLAAAVALKLRDEDKHLAAEILIYPTLQFMDFSLPSFQNHDTRLLSLRQAAEYWSYYMTGTPNMVASFLANNHSRHLRNTKYSSYIGIDNKGKRSLPKKPSDGIPVAVLDGLVDYRASPLMAESLKGLPKTLIITCEFDVLKDDGLLYRARLLDAGVKVTHLNYMSYHAFLLVQALPYFETEELNQALRDIVDYVKGV